MTMDLETLEAMLKQAGFRYQTRPSMANDGATRLELPETWGRGQPYVLYLFDSDGALKSVHLRKSFMPEEPVKTPAEQRNQLLGAMSCNVPGAWEQLIAFDKDVKPIPAPLLPGEEALLTIAGHVAGERYEYIRNGEEVYRVFIYRPSGQYPEEARSRRFYCTMAAWATSPAATRTGI